MRSISIASLALALVLSGCMPHPAIAKFRGEYGCNDARAFPLEDDAWRVEGCGVDATYVCAQAEAGGSTICVHDRRDRVPTRAEGEDEGARHEARLSLSGDGDAARLSFAVANAPALVFRRGGGPNVLVVRRPACGEASVRGASGAVLTAELVAGPGPTEHVDDEDDGDVPREDPDEEEAEEEAEEGSEEGADDADRDPPDERTPSSERAASTPALGWPLSAFARFASEDALRFTLCGTEIELRGSEMQVFRDFVARAGELR